jgi:Domain of unknown function (DUF5060)/Domain of unknown function (DUF5605)/Protein of unknown function (DUF4038)
MRTLFCKACLFIFLLGKVSDGVAQTETAERWGRFEISLQGPSAGNPFTDLWLSAEFTNGIKKVEVNGFYDGDGIYKIRFMPGEQGDWNYITKSNSKALNNKKGNFKSVPASASNHGPVQVKGTYNFEYADGKIYYPFGTTIYAWIHQETALQEQTLGSLGAAPFNKVRMCVFPKVYSYVEDDPELYPYKNISATKENSGKIKYTWDFKIFNPAFFKHLEKRIDDLDKLGIEADLILFHPYDKGKWGFDSMGKENDILYLKYITARLSSFRNVWWSLANEFDYIKSKPREAWEDYSKTVVDNDPYRHLCSIHNGSVYYDNWKTQFTHVSIQNCSAVEDFGRAVLLRDVYFKPIIYDEVCYEGNITQRWGNLSGEEMTEAFWQGMIAGTYVTHGETIRAGGDTIFWAEGGKFRGTSPARIAFLKKIMEEGPGPLQLADPWKDHQAAQNNSGYYIIYFGKKMLNEWQFSLPKKNGPTANTKFMVEIIDTWEMSISQWPEVFVTSTADGYRIFDKAMKKIKLPLRPYLALRIKQVE